MSYPAKQVFRPYKLKPKGGHLPLTSQRPSYATAAEQLMGSVTGIPATQGEERFARALLRDKNVLTFYFRMPIGAPHGMPGWKELDYFVQTVMGYRAVQIDGVDFVHLGTQGIDILRDRATIGDLKNYGIGEVIHVRADQLATQDEANRVVRRLF
jgi:hypothetical protein